MGTLPATLCVRRVSWTPVKVLSRPDYLDALSGFIPSLCFRFSIIFLCKGFSILESAVCCLSLVAYTDFVPSPTNARLLPHLILLILTSQCFPQVPPPPPALITTHPILSSIIRLASIVSRCSRLVLHSLFSLFIPLSHVLRHAVVNVHSYHTSPRLYLPTKYICM